MARRIHTMVGRENSHSDSRFVGFDSFEGLPEDWNSENPKGHFTTQGRAQPYLTNVVASMLDTSTRPCRRLSRLSRLAINWYCNWMQIYTAQHSMYSASCGRI